MTPAVLDDLTDARARTLELLATLGDDALVAQHSPLMSPLVWDLAHIAHYEELWLLRELGAGPATDPRFDDVYDAFKHPRAERPTLDLLDPDGARAFGESVRRRVADAEIPPTGEARVDALLAADFVYRMVVRHEHQHIETMLATIQLMDDAAVPAGDGPGQASARPDAVAQEILIPAGPFVMGTDTDAWSYDNERPAHAVELPAFLIDATPTTNAEFVAFVEAGGYDDPTHWSETGWKWRQEAALVHPEFWSLRPDGWHRHRYGRDEPLPPLEPVQHVGWYEADAYARWAGKRLPTEAEWEKAASWDAGSGDAVKRPTPWATDVDPRHGDLWNPGRRFGPDEVGAHPDGASPYGVLDMLGGVWEWTASDFAGHPGFASFPYREYSEVFFGPDYKVLRGGSWATHPHAVSTTFRNWDYPIRRQIFSGFRCARGPLTVCRHLAYVGPPRPVRDFVFDAPHALVHQGRAPREMVVARDNPDGWGVAWWPPGALEPRRYRTVTVMWEDTGFTAGDEKAVALLAAVRKASPNTTLDAVNNAPFLAESRVGPLAFSLNGHAFHESCAPRVRAALAPDAPLVGDTDSEALFALTRERIEVGCSPAEALAAVHHVIAPGPEVYVNLLLVTPEQIVATTWQHTLYVQTAAPGTTVASEALDLDDGWARVPDASLLVADADHVRITPLEGNP